MTLGKRTELPPPPSFPPFKFTCPLLHHTLCLFKPQREGGAFTEPDWKKWVTLILFLLHLSQLQNALCLRSISVLSMSIHSTAALREPPAPPQLYIIFVCPSTNSNRSIPSLAKDCLPGRRAQHNVDRADPARVLHVAVNLRSKFSSKAKGLHVRDTQYR